MSISACEGLGMLMPLPHTRCQYLECVHTELGSSTEGLLSIVRDCPGGTSVPLTYKAGFYSPCTKFYKNCVKERESNYQNTHPSQSLILSI